MGNSDNVFSTILLVSAFWLIAFLVFRHVVCWYWKINKHIELQEEILTQLRKMNSKESK